MHDDVNNCYVWCIDRVSFYGNHAVLATLIVMITYVMHARIISCAPT